MARLLLLNLRACSTHSCLTEMMWHLTKCTIFSVFNKSLSHDRKRDILSQMFLQRTCFENNRYGLWKHAWGRHKIWLRPKTASPTPPDIVKSFVRTQNMRHFPGMHCTALLRLFGVHRHNQRKKTVIFSSDQTNWYGKWRFWKVLLSLPYTQTQMLPRWGPKVHLMNQILLVL